MTSDRVLPVMVVALVPLGVLLSVPLLYLYLIQPRYERKMSEMNRQLDLAHHEVVLVREADRQPAVFHSLTETLERRLRAQRHLRPARDTQQITLAVRELLAPSRISLRDHPVPAADPMWVHWTAQVDTDSFDTLSSFESDLVSIGGGISAIDAVREVDGRVHGSFEIAVAISDPFGVEVRPLVGK